MDDDDDFGDFGGFEAADPIEVQEASACSQGVTATPSPWAIYTAAAVQGVVDPAALTAVMGANQEGTSELEGSALSETIGQSETTCSDKNALPVEAKPDDKLMHPESPITDKTVQVETVVATPDTPEESQGMLGAEVNSDGNSTPEDVDESQLSATHLVEKESSVSATKTEGCEPEEVQALRTHRDNLLKELEKMSQKQILWERELSECKTQLLNQVARYDELQVVHSDALTEIRKAGHDALAIIVSEYQELTKLNMAEQKETNERELIARLDENNTRWQNHVKQQEELTKVALEEMRTEMSGQLQEALKIQQDQCQEEMKKTLKEECENHRTNLKDALEAQNETSKAALQVALQEERLKLTGLAQEEKVKLQALLENERLKSREAIQVILEEQRAHSKVCVDTARREERRQSDDHAERVMEEARREMKSYIQQQQQADAAVRLRTLTTMDMFLDGARKQLDIIMNQQSTDSATSTL